MYLRVVVAPGSRSADCPQWELHEQINTGPMSVSVFRVSVSCSEPDWCYWVRKWSFGWPDCQLEQFSFIGHFSILTAPFRISIMPANSISVAVKSASSFLLIVVAATWSFSFSAVQFNFSFEVSQTVSEGRVRLPSRACVVLMSSHTQKQYECNFV